MQAWLERQWYRDGWWAQVLFPVDLLLTLIVWLRRTAYRHGILSSWRAPVPVVVVGNITVGGTGKTPLTELLARALKAQGRKVAILSRGYKSKRVRKIPRWKKWLAKLRGKPLPARLPRVVSDGQKVLLDSYVAGDEPFMLATNLPGVPVVVDKDRVKAGLHAIKNFGTDTLLLDDGLQYLRLKHRLDMVLVDRTAPWGNGYLLPRGTLREPKRHLKRASYIFITKCGEGDNSEFVAELRKLNRIAEIIECRHRPVHLENIQTREKKPLEVLYGAHIGSISGIAVPKSFEEGLLKLGAKLDATVHFADHHRFTHQDIKQFLERCERRDVRMIVTTEKDFVRFPTLPPDLDIPIYFLRVEMEIVRGKESFDRMIRLLCEQRPMPRPIYGAELTSASMENDFE